MKIVERFFYKNARRNSRTRRTNFVNAQTRKFCERKNHHDHNGVGKKERREDEEETDDVTILRGHLFELFEIRQNERLESAFERFPRSVVTRTKRRRGGVSRERERKRRNKR